MKRPDIERIQKQQIDARERPWLSDYTYNLITKSLPALCEYALYLERRIHDMQLGAEVDETHFPKSPAENPV